MTLSFLPLILSLRDDCLQKAEHEITGEVTRLLTSELAIILKSALLSMASLSNYRPDPKKVTGSSKAHFWELLCCPHTEIREDSALLPETVGSSAVHHGLLFPGSCSLALIGSGQLERACQMAMLMNFCFLLWPVKKYHTVSESRPSMGSGRHRNTGTPCPSSPPRL